ncbi:hypothetical protein PQX77_012803 [Marasmius sp. AFHP31]|nr:hypothetical protein PQX77_012803 [Marasmius sp. AFHP31]
MSESTASPSTQPRRSTRTRKRTTYCDSEDHEDPSGDGSSKERKPKRRRKAEKQYKRSVSKIEQSKPTTRRVRGLLQRLKEFPLDVVFIIFEYLTPQDLLSLARTSKDLRNLLLSRSTVSIWKAARSNVEDLPDIPDDMSEPAYAHLCFDAQCHHCDGKHPAVNVLWYNRTRSCHACVDNPYNYFVEPVLPNYYSVHERGFAPRNDLLRDLWAILQPRGDIISGKQRKGYFFVCSVDIYQQLSDGWEANKHDPSWIAARNTEGDVGKKASSGAQFQMHAEEMGNWWRNRTKEHKSELAVRRKAREDAILQRLSDIGWAKEIDAQRKRNNLSCLHQFRIGTQTKKLTTKDWNELRPKLESALQEAKTDRLRSELRAKWKQRYLAFKSLLQDELDKLPFNTVGPSVFDIANLPQFREKLLLPIEHELTEADLTDLITELPQMRSRWIQAREEDLIKLLKNSGIADETSDRLHYAATIFLCKHCSALCVYPRPLVHKCTRLRSKWSNFPTVSDPSFTNFLDATSGKVWNINYFSYDATRSTRAQSILSVIGFPASATVEDVRNSDAWVEWSPNDGGKRHLYPAIRAMYMFPKLDGWKLVSPEEAAGAVRDSGLVDLSPHSDGTQCTRCEMLFHYPREIRRHMKDEHNLDDSECSARDFISHVDSDFTYGQRWAVVRESHPATAAEAGAESCGVIASDDAPPAGHSNVGTEQKLAE